MAKIYKQASGAAIPPTGAAAYGDIAIRKDGRMLVCDSGGNWADPSDAKTFGGQPPEYYGTAAGVADVRGVAGVAYEAATAVKNELSNTASGSISFRNGVVLSGTMATVISANMVTRRGNLATISLAIERANIQHDTDVGTISAANLIPLSGSYACIAKTEGGVWRQARMTTDGGAIRFATSAGQTIFDVVVNATAFANELY